MTTAPAPAIAAPFGLDAPDRLTLARALSGQGQPLRAYAILLDLHERASATADTRMMAETADSLADCAYMTARYEQGIHFARTAGALWLARPDPGRAAVSLSLMAVMLATIGEPEALAEAEAARSHAERSAQPASIIRARDASGAVLSLLRQPDRGLILCERAVAMSRSHRLLDGRALINLAELVMQDALRRQAVPQDGAAPARRLAAAAARALDLTQEALAVARTTGDGWLERLATLNTAEYSLQVGNMATARQALFQFEHAAGEATNRCRIHHLMVRGRMLAATGQHEAAIADLLACRTIALTTNDLETAVPCQQDLAAAHASLGNYQAAYAAHREYHALYVRQASETVQRRARIFAMQHEAEELRAAARQAEARAADLSATNARLSREADRLLRTSLEDPLTGLANRRRLQMAFDELDMTSAPFALAMIDADHFKQINDTFSHEVGDAALRRLADLLAGAARQDDLVARYGGEEFALLISGADLATAERICERLRHKIAQADWPLLRPGLAITVSIGIATSAEAASSRAALVLADQRLYAAKKAGRNRVLASA